ncbi:MAG: CDP-diacylglycerol--glycerol-3-phosphate 3-phosphatidyltransferase [Tissierellia bacterium]|nr:CDP-diacylglycerol--glycerol-3-phosphate 3-phosphatidyltransferase [Tissierellia bacterium]
MNIANKLTVFRILLVPVFIICLEVFHLDNYIPFIVFVVAALTDSLDGYFARSRNLITTFGKFLDPIADKLLALSAFIMLVGMDIIPAWSVCIIVAREIVITGFRIIAASNNITIAASNLGKIKTISQFLSICLILSKIKLGINIDLLVYYFSVVFTILSGIDYIMKNKSVLDLSNI